MIRGQQDGIWANQTHLVKLGLTEAVVREAIEYTYKVLDTLDQTLVQADELRMAGLVELANLSAIIGNLFRGGIAKASHGQFEANGPHKYPDLISKDEKFGHIEIKVALEGNSPKGHLIKPGPHLTVRYVLGDEQGKYERGYRGSVVWIWEVRAGFLENTHFNVSNTAGDSGKTAVINKAGLDALKVAFVDLERCPISLKGPRFAAYRALSSR